ARAGAARFEPVADGGRPHAARCDTRSHPATASARRDATAPTLARMPRRQRRAPYRRRRSPGRATRSAAGVPADTTSRSRGRRRALHAQVTNGPAMPGRSSRIVESAVEDVFDDLAGAARRPAVLVAQALLGMLDVAEHAGELLGLVAVDRERVRRRSG